MTKTSHPAPLTAPERPLVRSNTLHVRLERQLFNAVIDAAVARGMTSSEWVRQAARTSAMLEGTLRIDAPSRSAGALYNRVESRRRWARIEGDQINSWLGGRARIQTIGEPINPGSCTTERN